MAVLVEGYFDTAADAAVADHRARRIASLHASAPRLALADRDLPNDGPLPGRVVVVADPHISYHDPAPGRGVIL